MKTHKPDNSRGHERASDYLLKPTSSKRLNSFGCLRNQTKIDFDEDEILKAEMSSDCNQVFLH